MQSATTVYRVSLQRYWGDIYAKPINWVLVELFKYLHMKKDYITLNYHHRYISILTYKLEPFSGQSCS